jgi:nitric oxide reductase activation protein
VIPYVTAQSKSPYGIATMQARSGNIDGAALWYAAQELAKFDADAERRILFCISDGLPSGGQEDGVEYNRRKAEASRNIGVEVFGIGILNAYSDHIGERLFGKDAYCVFPDVESAGQVIGAFITRVVNRL